MSTELFETNFMLSLKQIFGMGNIHSLPSDSTKRVKGITGLTFRVTSDSIPLLKSSKLEDSVQTTIINTATDTAKSCITSTIANGADFWNSIMMELESGPWITFVEHDNTLSLIGTLKSYDILKDHVKPMLESRIVLEIVANYFNLNVGDCFILSGETYISEEDESVAIELLRRFGVVGSRTIIDTMYTGDDHEENHTNAISSITDMQKKLTMISDVNNSTDRNFDGLVGILPDDSIDKLHNMTYDEVSEYIRNGMTDMKNELENIAELDKMFELYRDVLTDPKVDFFTTFPEIDSTTDTVDNISVTIKNVVGLPSLLN